MIFLSFKIYFPLFVSLNLPVPANTAVLPDLVFLQAGTGSITEGTDTMLEKQHSQTCTNHQIAPSEHPIVFWLEMPSDTQP